LVNIVLSEETLSISTIGVNAVRFKFYKETEEGLPELFFTMSGSNPGFQVTDSPSRLKIMAKTLI
jgi:hypothetical protein